MADDRDHEAATRDGISADLPIELQSKLFDQLAAMGVGGAGLVITLAGSLLQGHKLIWMAAAEFGLVAMIAMAGQFHLIEALFHGKPIRKQSRLLTIIAIMLMGMGIGSLGTSVFLEGGAKTAPAAQKAKP